MTMMECANLQIAYIAYNLITMKMLNSTKISLTPESEIGYTGCEKASRPHDKGKPSERWGRKATGLRLEMAMIGGLPKEEGIVRLFLNPTRRGTVFLFTDSVGGTS